MEVAEHLAAAAWAELSCVNLSLDIDAFAEIADLNETAPRDVAPHGDLWGVVDSRLGPLEYYFLSAGGDVVCERLLESRTEGPAAGALVADTSEAPSLDRVGAVAREHIVAGAMRRQAVARDIIVEALVAEQECAFSADHVSLGQLAGHGAITFSAPDQATAAQVAADALRGSITHEGRDRWCAMALNRFGPSGGTVAGLLR